jgi:hypothetical protein
VCVFVQHVTSIGLSASSLYSEIRLSVFCIKVSRHRRHGKREVASTELCYIPHQPLMAPCFVIPSTTLNAFGPPRSQHLEGCGYFYNPPSYEKPHKCNASPRIDSWNAFDHCHALTICHLLHLEARRSEKAKAATLHNYLTSLIQLEAYQCEM